LDFRFHIFISYDKGLPQEFIPPLIPHALSFGQAEGLAKVRTPHGKRHREDQLKLGVVYHLGNSKNG
jgi:hypothetical protein